LTDRIKMSALLSADTTVLQKVVKRICDGEIFVYPTDTIYGIGGRADSVTVMERIRSVKGRQKTSPFIVIAADQKSFSGFDLQFSPKAIKLAKTYWPGKLTLILDSPQYPDGLGVRVSQHPFLTAMSPLFSLPLFSTSANISAEPYNNNPDVIYRIFDGKVDFMIDAGRLVESQPSTVIRVASDDRCEYVREGIIAFCDIEAVLR